MGQPLRTAQPQSGALGVSCSLGVGRGSSCTDWGVVCPLLPHVPRIFYFLQLPEGLYPALTVGLGCVRRGEN